MENVKSATPIKGFNIKTKDGILFGGQPIYPPFNVDVMYDITHNPERWDIVYQSPEERIVLGDAPAKEVASQLKKKRRTSNRKSA